MSEKPQRKYNIFGVPSALPLIQVKAAQLLGANELSHAEICAKLSISKMKLWRWTQDPNFTAEINRYRKIVAEQILQHGATEKFNRVRRLEIGLKRIEAIFEARSGALKDAVPGGETGLLSRDLKSVGAGPSAQVVEVYEFDAALYKEFRATLEQFAKEMGGQFEQHEDAGRGVNIAISFPVIDAAKQQAELDNAPVIDLPPAHKRRIGKG